MRLLIAGASVLATCAALAQTTDPQSDAPDPGDARTSEFKAAPSYGEALRLWQNAEDVNAWIGARFRYDTVRAMQLSETQRRRSDRLPIIAPADFFAAPSGVCVDVARFAVESLRVVEPAARPRYLMIEFDPVSIGGNTLRRHWLVSFERDGKHYFVADSKRPGHIAGPYASSDEFIAEYARYRGRRIVSFVERDSHERTMRTPAVRQPAS